MKIIAEARLSDSWHAIVVCIALFKGLWPQININYS